MKLRYTLTLLSAVLLTGTSFKPRTKEAQKPNNSSLEAIIVEKYYLSDERDITDTTGGALPKGSVTYRVFVDMKPGYTLQAVYGVPGHDLIIQTTTEFFNNKKGGGKTGDLIDDKMINDNTVALDSWLTLGAATKSHLGIVRSDDKDGSIIKRITLDKTDGLITGKGPAIINYLLDMSCFDNAEKSSRFFSNNGSLAAFSSVQGTTEDNRVLIAQLTTNGKLAFELNLQMGTPDCKIENYVAKSPQGSEIQFDGLSYGE